MIFFEYLFIFCLFSTVGWILELAYRSTVNKRFINPGFMSGCVVPLYGFGALILTILCNLFLNINSTYKVILIFFLAIILMTILEFISGFILLKCFHLRLWDYSMFKYNYKGFVCLEFSLLWGMLSLIFYVFIFPHINSLAQSFVNNKICIFFLGIFFGIFLVDLCVSINLLDKLNKYAKDMASIINVEKLKLDVRRKETKKKFINAVYPYLSTNRFLKDKIKNNKK